MLRLPALFATRHLTFDDGVYGASAQAMRAGGFPFRDVFSSQGPLFLPLVWAFDALGFGWRQSPRLLALASGVALTLAAWSIARQLATPERARRAGIGAGLLVATSGSVLWTTGPIASDGPALAAAAWAIALTLRWRTRLDAHPNGPVAWAVLLAVGGLAGAAFAIKSLLVVGPLVVVAGLLMTARPRRTWPIREVLGAGGAGVLVVAAATLALGPGDVWNQWVVYHLVHAGNREPIANAGRILGVLFSREWLLMTVGGASLGFALWRRVIRPRVPIVARSTAPLWWWAALTLAILLLQTPMWRPHVVYLVVPLAILVGLALPPWPVLATAALLALVPYWYGLGDYFAPGGYTGRQAVIVEAIRALPPDVLVISDDPGLVWGGGGRTPPWMVDASRLRTGTDVEAVRIDTELLIAQANEPNVCMVIVTSARFADLDGIDEALTRAEFEPAIEFGSGRAVWTKPSPRCIR